MEHVGLGTSIGRAGMIPVDLDGDGSQEIVASAALGGGFSNSYSWYIAKFQPASSSYEIVWVAPRPISGNVTSLNVYDAGAGKKILVGLDTGHVQVFDGATRLMERDIAVSASAVAITAVVYADANNDGTPEIVAVSPSTTYLINPLTMAVKLSFAYGGSDVAIGNVDGDAGNELVYPTGKVIQVKTGLSATEKWDFSVFAAGTYVGLSDIDGDGMKEICFCTQLVCN